MWVGWEILFNKEAAFEMMAATLYQGVLAALGATMLISAVLLPFYYFISYGKGSIHHLLIKLHLKGKSSPPSYFERQFTNHQNVHNLSSLDDSEEDVLLNNNASRGGGSSVDTRVETKCGFSYMLGPIVLMSAGFLLIAIDSLILWTIPENGNSISESWLLGIAFFPVTSKHYVVEYSISNWLAVGMFGIVFGNAIIHPQQRGRAMGWLLLMSCIVLGLFPISQICGWFFTFYLPGSDYWNGSWMDFLYVVKYPPSISYLLLTMGVIGIFNN